MRCRYLKQGTITFLAIAVIIVGGCGPKILRPDPGVPGMGGPRVGGPLVEQDLQAVQVNLRVVYFDYDQYNLTPEAQATANYNAEILKGAPHLAVLIEGHCDQRGTDEYNLALGEKRARAVAEYLTTLGVPNRLSTVSYGSELPADPGHNESAWAKNRRAQMRVSR
ncbi:MAG: peptidoglycan-associated lipoprotein Pal [Deltaproteobacteria bacterium]|nr:peptidoglycan-associated lipoprotein Pal [Deltaproteobacteria bacterium]